MPMNRPRCIHALGSLLLFASIEAQAQSLYQVPVKSVETVTVQQVIHQRVCNAAVSVAHTPPSASETVAGAVIGGAIGGALAHGPGQAAATVLGAVAGATLGGRRADVVVGGRDARCRLRRGHHGDQRLHLAVEAR